MKMQEPGPSGPAGDASANVTTGEAKAMPKDAQVMAAILRDMGITEWEPRVITQLLEFSYRYVTSVLEDAKLVSSHARKKALDLEDVRLAVQMYSDQNVTTPPSRDVLLEMARTKNASTLPIPKPTSGLRLPPDRHCLTSCNYKLKSFKKKPAGRATTYPYGASPSPAMSKGPGSRGPNPTFSMMPMATPQGAPGQIQVRPQAMNMNIKINPSSMGGPGVVPQGQAPGMFTMSVHQPPITGVKRKADN